MFVPFLFEQVLLCYGHRHLRLQLQVLILDIQKKLFQ